MNLAETVQALRAKDITVAIDLGAHSSCRIDTNCPVAIELRRIMTDAGVTLPELLDGYEIFSVPDPVEYTLPEFNSNATMQIAGQNFHFDFNAIITVQLKDLIDRKIRSLDEQNARIGSLCQSLYDSYSYQIRRARDNHTLPQLSFSDRELMRAGCFITGEDKSYSFIFPVIYKPEYIIKDGIRYKIAEDTVGRLIYDVFLKFVIEDGIFMRAILLDESGDKFIHYHSDRRTDCWGAVTLPHRWDGRLSSLHTLSTALMRALATVNYNSLYSHDPPGMPYIGNVLDESTELGREGEIETPPVGRVTSPISAQAWGGTGWGRTRRNAPDPEEGEEEEDTPIEEEHR